MLFNAKCCVYFTAQQCPQFSHYSQCANACSSLCPEISQTVQCPRDCEEGCQCDTGHLYDGHACVPAEQCGCVQDGRRFKVRITQFVCSLIRSVNLVIPTLSLEITFVNANSMHEIVG